MPAPVLGLHHVTSKASDARRTDAFWRRVVGLRRVKQTVNFDNPEVYHLYFGDALGRPGSLVTHFPFPGLAPGIRGSGEVGQVTIAIPGADLSRWRAHLAEAGPGQPESVERFGEQVLEFTGPDTEPLALVAGGSAMVALHAVCLVLRETETSADILRFLGFREAAREGATTRFTLPGATRAAHVDLRKAPDLPAATEGAGSVHHVAFAVATEAALSEMRTALLARGLKVTKVYDRDYFRSIYFRTPGGVLFEIATNPPGFTIDEPEDSLGQRLCLPAQHAHLRQRLIASLPPLD